MAKGHADLVDFIEDMRKFPAIYWHARKCCESGHAWALYLPEDHPVNFSLAEIQYALACARLLGVPFEQS